MPVSDMLSDAMIQFLVRYAPFSRMARADLEFLAEHAQLAYYPVDAVIADAAAGDDGLLHIIYRGHVRSQNLEASEDCVVLGPGECFPLLNLSAGRASASRFVATEDLFAYRLSRSDFDDLCNRSTALREYVTTAMAAVMKESFANANQSLLGRTLNQSSLLEPLSSLIHREPIWCRGDTSIQEALARMSREKVGTIVVVDEGRKPLGIFTLTDLMDRVVLRRLPLTDSVAAVMTANPASLEERANAQDAIAAMASRGLHQLLVTREGTLTGVISERDLFSLQRVSIRSVLQQIRAAGDVNMLRSAARDIGILTDNLLAQGIAVEHLTRAMTALNDGLSQRVLELVQLQFSVNDIPWCWLSLGSEGRCEQTTVTDQDNAVIFDVDADRTEDARQRLLPFAKSVNEALAAVGFPLCPGNIMASNPDCCLSASEWRGRFASWIREPTAQALLNANIFFDLRPLFGAVDLAEQLRSWVLDHSGGQRLFLGLLTDNALQSEPPLGMIRSFRTDDDDHPGTVDLKSQGTRLFVDAARVLALCFGIPETHTTQRLRQGLRRLNLPERDSAGIIQAFEFIQLLRFRAQCGGAGAPRAPNRLDPYALSDPDQRLLKEAFRQARSLQALLKQQMAR